MAKKGKSTGTKKDTQAANLGFEAKLWLAADKLRTNMDAAEPSGARQIAKGNPQGERRVANQYKHVVLDLIFLKYISDAFEEMRGKLAAGEGNYAGADPEDADEYKAENVFWVPTEARWAHLQGSAKLPEIGTLVDNAMVAIKRDNPRLKGVLPKDFYDPACGSGGMFVQSEKFIEEHDGRIGDIAVYGQLRD